MAAMGNGGDQSPQMMLPDLMRVRTFMAASFQPFDSLAACADKPLDAVDDIAAG